MKYILHDNDVCFEYLPTNNDDTIPLVYDDLNTVNSCYYDIF